MADATGSIRIGDSSNSGTTSPEPVTLSATGLTSAAFLTADISIPLPTLEGSLEGPMAFPALTLSATAVNGAVGVLDDELPAATVSGTMLSGGAATGQINIPAPTVDASTGVQADIDVPALTLSGTMVNGAAISGAIRVPAPTVEADLLQHNTASGDITLAVMSVAAVGTSSGLATGAVTIAVPTLSATAVAGNTATAEITVPVVTLSADGSFDTTGTANIIMPMLQMGAAGGAVAQAVETLSNPTFTGLAVNTGNGAVSTYSGISANSACVFDGLTLMATANGIVALQGDTDRGAAIAAHIKGGVTDLGLEGFQTILTGYVGYRTDGDMEMTLITDGHHEYVYPVVPRQLDYQHATRMKFGRGVSGRYWQWKLANKRGSDFAIDNLTLNTQPLKKRV